MKEGFKHDFSQERQNQTEIDRIFLESVKNHRVEPKKIPVAMHREVANKLIDGNQSYLVAAAINDFQDLDPATLIALVDDGRENEVCEYLERQDSTDENKEAVYAKVRSKAVVNIKEWLSRKGSGGKHSEYHQVPDGWSEIKQEIQTGFEVLGNFSEGLGGGEHVENGYFIQLKNGQFATIGQWDTSVGGGIAYSPCGTDFDGFIKKIAEDENMRVLLAGGKPKHPYEEADDDNPDGTVYWNYLHWFQKIDSRVIAKIIDELGQEPRTTYEHEVRSWFVLEEDGLTDHYFELDAFKKIADAWGEWALQCRTDGLSFPPAEKSGSKALEEKRKVLDKMIDELKAKIEDLEFYDDIVTWNGGYVKVGLDP